MRTFIWPLVVAFLSAQETRLPQDETRRFAKLCVEQTMLADAQLKFDVDPDKACAERGEGGGAMVVPAKNLSVEKLGSDVVPIGQLWLRKWTAVIDGKAAPKERVRMMSIRIDDKNRPMPLFLLGLRQKNGKEELVVFAKNFEPFQVLPATKIEQIPTLPVEIEWKAGEKNLDTLTITVAGKVRATMLVTRQLD